MKKIFLVSVFLFSNFVWADDSMLQNLEAFRKAILEPKTLLKDLNPIRQADMGLIVDRTWVERDSSGQFVEKMERICAQKMKVNVYDVRNQEWHYPSMNPQATCETSLDSRDGSKTFKVNVDLGGFIYLNAAQNNRSVKNFSPWAFVKAQGGPSWPLTGFVMTPNLDLQEVAFVFGNQTEVFFQDQTITMTASFLDKTN